MRPSTAVVAGGPALLRHTEHGCAVHAVGGAGEALAAFSLPACDGPAFLTLDVHVDAGSVEIRWDSPRGIVDDAVVDLRTDAPVQSMTLEGPGVAATDRLVLVGREPDGSPTVVTIRNVEVHALAPLAVRSTAHGLDDALLAVYDMRRYPPGLMFAPFLLHADATRQRLGIDRIRVVALPDDRRGPSRLPRGYEAAFDRSLRDSWCETLLPDLCRMVPSVEALEVRDDRAAVIREALSAVHVFPSPLMKNPGTPPAIFESLRATSRAGTPRLVAPREARERVAGWLSEAFGGPDAVVFVIRDEPYLPAMNSDLSEWRKAAMRLECPVVLARDPRRPGESPAEGPWEVFPWSDAVSLQALHELATITLADFGETATPLLFGCAEFALWVPVDAGGHDVDPHILELFGLKGAATPEAADPRRRTFYRAPTADELVDVASAALRPVTRGWNPADPRT